MFRDALGNPYITIHDRNEQRVMPLYPEGTRLHPPVPAEIVDPYAPHTPQAINLLVRHTITPESRAVAMLVKTTAVTIFLSLLTLAALIMLDSLTFFLWLLLASCEWVLCFVLLAVLDWRETPSAVQWRLTDGYLALMRREQTARLMTTYGIDPKDLNA